MAMTAAQFLATLPPAEQQQVSASLDPANYQAALDAWFQGGVDAGDPRFVQASGGGKAEEATGGIADFSAAADPSQWQGKRAPTPRELRKMAQMSGQSEDYARYDDRQLAAWVKKNWNVAGGYFANDYGDKVEKPTESGPLSTAAGAATGEKGVGGKGGGGGGGKGKGSASSTPAEAPVNQALQDKLMGLFSNQGGYFADKPVAMGLKTGGMIWQDKQQPQVPGAATATPIAPGAPFTKGTPLPGAAPGAVALTKGVLGAFTPGAATPGTPTVAMSPGATAPGTPAPWAATPGTSPPASSIAFNPGTPAPGSTPFAVGPAPAPGASFEATPGVNPLARSISRRYTSPYSWLGR